MKEKTSGHRNRIVPPSNLTYIGEGLKMDEKNGGFDIQNCSFTLKKNEVPECTRENTFWKKKHKNRLVQQYHSSPRVTSVCLHHFQQTYNVDSKTYRLRLMHFQSDLA